MRHRAALPVAALAVLAASLAAGCSSGPPSLAWCAPLVTAFHAHQSRQAYLNGLVAVEKQGAPVGQMIKDETAYTENRVVANSAGVSAFAAVAAGPAVLAKVSADLQQLNAECGQPADAYKSDDA